MIDMHTHLDLYPNALDILQEVNSKNLYTLAVTTSPKAWIATSLMFKKYSNIKVALGLHPEIACKKFDELDMLLDLIGKASGVGEIGIDGTPARRTTLEQQEFIFCSAIEECAKVGGKIISIHSRGATAKVLSILRKHPDCGLPILHWFSGSQTELDQAIKMQCYFSVNPLMLKNKTGRGLVSKIPPKLILPESDGPFAILRGRSIMPWEAMNVCTDLSDIWSIPQVDVKNVLVSNYANIIALNRDVPSTP